MGRVENLQACAAAGRRTMWRRGRVQAPELAGVGWFNGFARLPLAAVSVCGGRARVTCGRLLASLPRVSLWDRRYGSSRYADTHVLAACQLVVLDASWRDGAAVQQLPAAAVDPSHSLEELGA